MSKDKGKSEKSYSVLVVDDNATVREGIELTLARSGYGVRTENGGQAGLDAFAEGGFDLVITDLKMEPVDGMSVLRGVKEQSPSCPVMVITAYGTVETAVEAMKLGAFDFITKPFKPDELKMKVSRALEFADLAETNKVLVAENKQARGVDEVTPGENAMIGSGKLMETLRGSIKRVAATDSTVLILGESGVGKELVARAIHEQSERAERPYVRVNCGAFAETLLESELFGHEKGAFTGADAKKIGRFELADGGTIFLDEIGDVSPVVQLKLLRVLQEREIERVGGVATIPVDVRIVSATNKDLEQEVAEGRFREDLYFRLHIIPLAVPPLRERRGDIAELVTHFIKVIGARVNSSLTGISQAALDKLESYPWPGNVRELEHCIERILVLCEGEEILPEHVPELRPPRKAASELGQPEGAALENLENYTLPEYLDTIERRLIEQTLDKSKGNKSETARRLGIKTSALYYKLDKYELAGEAGD